VTPILIVAVTLLALCIWFFWPRHMAPRSAAPRRAQEDVDSAELERAEREVQEAQDEDTVRDWGPGTSGTPRG
jgi:beta-lactam-binding protein with PASTA domain